MHTTQRIKKSVDPVFFSFFSGTTEAKHVRGCDDLKISLLRRSEKKKKLQQTGVGNSQRILLLAPLESLSFRGGQGGTC